MRLQDSKGRATWLLLFITLIRADDGRAGGLDPEDAGRLRVQIEGLLQSELTEHWYPHALDRDLGGFHQTFARDWTPLPDENRFAVYQARMTWTAAAYARFNPNHRDKFLDYAGHGIEYLDRVLRDHDQGGFHFVLGPSGKVDPRLGTEKHIYGTAFVLYAASTVHAVARDDLSLKVARDAFDWLESQAHDRRHGGYFEALTRAGSPILGWAPHAPIAARTDRIGTYYGFKSMNSHIHILEALTAYTAIDRRPIVRERLTEVFGIVRDRIAVEPGALNLYLTRDWRATPAHDSFGHDIETAYLLVEAAEALGTPDDPKTWQVARQLVDHALDWGWDSDHGGFSYKGEAFGGEAFDRHKDWWTQAEGLNALLLMHRKFADETDRYGSAFLKHWQFIEAHQIDPVHGGWFADVTREGALIGDGRKANPWKANYHTARALMNVARMLGEIEHEKAPARP